MSRERFSVDIPDEWQENMKHGRCWCGKDHTEFDKGQKFYCSIEHANEYSKRIKYWSTFKEEVLEEQGRKCCKCNHTRETFEKMEEENGIEYYKQAALKYPEAVKESRAIAIKNLQEQFEQLQDDGYVFEHINYHVAEKFKIPRSHYQRPFFQLDVDHIIAICLGGAMWDKKNMQVICNECHKIKTKEDMKKLKAKRKEKKND